jgi:hypothetical protein
VNQRLWTAIMGGAGWGQRAASPSRSRLVRSFALSVSGFMKSACYRRVLRLSNGNMRNQRVTLHWGMAF